MRARLSAPPTRNEERRTIGGAKRSVPPTPCLGVGQGNSAGFIVTCFATLTNDVTTLVRPLYGVPYFKVLGVGLVFAIGVAADIGWRRCAPRTWRRQWGGRGTTSGPMAQKMEMDDMRETLLEHDSQSQQDDSNSNSYDSDGYNDTVDHDGAGAGGRFSSGGGGGGGAGGLHGDDEDPFAEVDRILNNSTAAGGGARGGQTARYSDSDA